MDRLSSYKTVVYAEEGKTKVIYHSTAVVTWDENSIVLNTGGYRSVTTKRKMNQASRQYDLGYSVFQKNHEWYVEYKGKTIPYDNDDLILPR